MEEYKTTRVITEIAECVLEVSANYLVFARVEVNFLLLTGRSLKTHMALTVRLKNKGRNKSTSQKSNACLSKSESFLIWLPNNMRRNKNELWQFRARRVS